MRKNIIIVVNEKRSEPSIEEEFQNDCYSYMADFAEKILNSEEQREISLLQQASNMQTAFSFVIAALFMLIPVVIDNRGNMSLEYLLLMFSSITAMLLFSLFAATMAQNRSNLNTYPEVCDIENTVIEEYENFLTEAQRSKYLVNTYTIIHKSYCENNDKRCKWVRISMGSFYFSILLGAFWFIVSMLIIF